MDRRSAYLAILLAAILVAAVIIVYAQTTVSNTYTVYWVYNETYAVASASIYQAIINYIENYIVRSSYSYIVEASYYECCYLIRNGTVYDICRNVTYVPNDTWIYPECRIRLALWIDYTDAANFSFAVTVGGNVSEEIYSYGLTGVIATLRNQTFTAWLERFDPNNVTVIVYMNDIPDEPPFNDVDRFLYIYFCPSGGGQLTGYTFMNLSYSVYGVQHVEEFIPPSPPTTTTTPAPTLPGPRVQLPALPSFSPPIPSIFISRPSLYSPYGLLMLALFLGIFIIYAKLFTWAQALSVAAGICLVISIALFGYDMMAVFAILFLLGLGLWKVLGK